MANQFLNAVEYANTMLLLVKNRLVMGKLVDSSFKNLVTDENGLEINVKRPPRFVATDGPTLQTQGIVTGRTNLKVDQYKGVHIEVGDIEYVESYNALMRNQSMMSAASTLAETVDSFLHGKTLEFNNWVGTPGQTIKSPQQFNKGWTRLEELAVPGENRCAVVTSVDAENIIGFLINTDINNNNKVALERARVPLLSDIDVYHTQKIAALTTGTRTASGAAQVDGADQNVNYRAAANTMTQVLSIKGLTIGHTIRKGEVFSYAGGFAVNPRDAQAYDHLQQFTVMEDVTAAAATADIVISPPIIVPNTGGATNEKVNTAFATVTAAPADSAAITWLGAPSTTYRAASAFHKSAISLVYAQLQKPFTGESSFATDPDTGISIRYWRGSDITTGKHIHRWDMIYGATNVDRLLGTRISGAALS